MCLIICNTFVVLLIFIWRWSPYKNKQDYKGVTNDKTQDSHTRETGVSRSDDDILARNLDAENKNTEDDE